MEAVWQTTSLIPTTQTLKSPANAEAAKAKLQQHKPFQGEIVTEIVPAGEFYPAEDHHQDYATKNPIRYKFYRTSCGRDQRLKELWGKTPE